MLKGLSQGRLAWQCESRVGPDFYLPLWIGPLHPIRGPDRAPRGREGWSALLSLLGEGARGGSLHPAQALCAQPLTGAPPLSSP